MPPQDRNTQLNIEIPRPQQVDYNPPQDMTPPPESGAGWMGKTGQMADIGFNILHGWMAGQNVAAERKMKQAVRDVDLSRQTVDMLRGEYEQKLNAGADPDSQEMKNLGKLVAQNFQEYANVMAKYTASPDTGKGGKGKSVGSKMKKGFAPGMEQAVLYKDFATQGLQKLAQQAQEDPSILLPKQNLETAQARQFRQPYLNALKDQGEADKAYKAAVKTKEEADQFPAGAHGFGGKVIAEAQVQGAKEKLDEAWGQVDATNAQWMMYNGTPPSTTLVDRLKEQYLRSVADGREPNPNIITALQNVGAVKSARPFLQKTLLPDPTKKTGYAEVWYDMNMPDPEHPDQLGKEVKRTDGIPPRSLTTREIRTYDPVSGQWTVSISKPVLPGGQPETPSGIYVPDGNGKWHRFTNQDDADNFILDMQAAQSGQTIP